MYRKPFVLLIFVLIVGVVACDSLFPTAISDIQENPRHYEGKEVLVSGVVVDIYSIFLLKGFIVKDKTGEIMIVTKRTLPKKNATVKIYGTIEEAFSFGEKSLTVLMETDKQ